MLRAMHIDFFPLILHVVKYICFQELKITEITHILPSLLPELKMALQQNKQSPKNQALNIALSCPI